MIKSVFVSFNLTAENYQELGGVGANHYIAAGGALDEEKWWILKRTEARLAISLSAFGGAICPLNPTVKEKLKEKVNTALKWDAKEIWLNHFYFGGDSLDQKHHAPCEWCQGKDRVREITKLASWVKSLVPSPTSVGYFAIPLKVSGQQKFVLEFGQDHRLIGKIFDMASPVLYHQIFNKSPSFISEYVSYLNSLTQKPVLPIIQITGGSRKDLVQTYHEAQKLPSVGVCLYGWERAIESSKIEFIRELFSLS